MFAPIFYVVQLFLLVLTYLTLFLEEHHLGMIGISAPLFFKANHSDTSCGIFGGQNPLCPLQAVWRVSQSGFKGVGFLGPTEHSPLLGSVITIWKFGCGPLGHM